MKARLLWLTAWLVCLPVAPGYAGEIIIVEPAPPQGSRSERNAEWSRDEARQQAGKIGPATNIIITEQPANGRGPSQAEQASREAQDYVRGAPPGGDLAGEGTTVILRAAPIGDAERSRLKARSYVVPAAVRAKECSTVKSEVGTIGEGPGASHGSSVLEKGTSSVSVQTCR